MQKKEPLVIFYNGEDSFEKLMEKLIYRKLDKNKREAYKSSCNENLPDESSGV
ncbi:hypothetical protein IAI10_06015 [Clostridium sp. 19966]|uniref:hypothetical protein n=1 Tax=Clostridium sp. 19966 TaxID=2768166 RepID=UPI0028DEFDC0|nr:hypothetical protein [Clostridium sp. 19966]MDT8716205.1 hypothetical protein [Clostridium sp. 19966]